MPRLLQCLDCKTLDKLPDFDGDPDDDVTLINVIERFHTEPTGITHVGNMMRVDQFTWDNLDLRTQIEKDIWGAQAEYAATRDTYTEDAGKCFNRHNRPDEGCIDYCDSSKRIGNPNAAAWNRGPRVFLCQFCPVQSWVDTQQRAQRGAYK